MSQIIRRKDMDILQNYVNDAKRTESKFDAVNVNVEALMVTMKAFIAAGNLLDMIKKNVAYGKPINTEKWHEHSATLKTIGENINTIYNTDSLSSLNLDTRLFHAVIGIATESTELVEAIEVAVRENKSVDHVNILEELGDLNWYQALIVDTTNANWAHILDTNIAKLKARYPDKFTAENAIERNLVVERQILEDGANS